MAIELRTYRSTTSRRRDGWLCSFAADAGRREARTDGAAWRRRMDRFGDRSQANVAADRASAKQLRLKLLEQGFDGSYSLVRRTLSRGSECAPRSGPRLRAHPRQWSIGHAHGGSADDRDHSRHWSGTLAGPAPRMAILRTVAADTASGLNDGTGRGADFENWSIDGASD